jgi:nicotinamidase/pyrazinamidase
LTGNNLSVCLKVVSGAILLHKGTNPDVDSYSAFFDNVKSAGGGTGLDKRLVSRGVTTIYVSGVASDFCVGFTALDALDIDFTTFVVDDLSRGVEDGGIARMRKSILDAGGIFVNADQLARDAKCWSRIAAGNGVYKKPFFNAVGDGDHP